jgi:predicted transposase YdaD
MPTSILKILTLGILILTGNNSYKQRCLTREGGGEGGEKGEGGGREEGREERRGREGG